MKLGNANYNVEFQADMERILVLYDVKIDMLSVKAPRCQSKNPQAVPPIAAVIGGAMICLANSQVPYDMKLRILN
jgi:hypothetical protein